MTELRRRASGGGAPLTDRARPRRRAGGDPRAERGAESRLQDMQRVADATKAFEAMGSAERRLTEIAASFPRADADAADDQPAG